MKKIIVSLSSMLLASSLYAQEAAVKTANTWQSLFDGKTLTGWTQLAGTGTYVVKENTIVGTTTKGSPNSFLCTDKLYDNFELEFEVKVDNALNSGVQIRSITKETKNKKALKVSGPQCEIEATEIKGGGDAGYIYGEQAGGWRTPEADRKSHQHFNDGKWNHFRILTTGPRIQVWVNGRQVSDLTDEELYKTHAKGFIGLQVHGVGNKGPFSVAWKNIRIKELKPTAQK